MSSFYNKVLAKQSSKLFILYIYVWIELDNSIDIIIKKEILYSALKTFVLENF